MLRIRRVASVLVFAAAASVSALAGASLVETDAVKPIAGDPTATDTTYQTAFDGNINGSDLINVGSSVLSSFVHLGTNSNAGANPGAPGNDSGWAGLHDGASSTKAFGGSTNPIASNTYFATSDLTAAQQPTATFTFTTPQNISLIRMINGWGDTATFSNQAWSVYINGSATALKTVSYAPDPSSNGTLNGTANTTNGEDPNSTMVLLTDSLGGYIATNVSQIQFVWTGNGGTGQVVRELDVQSTPEPASLGLLGFASLLLLRRRR